MVYTANCVSHWVKTIILANSLRILFLTFFLHGQKKTNDEASRRKLKKEKKQQRSKKKIQREAKKDKITGKRQKKEY